MSPRATKANRWTLTESILVEDMRSDLRIIQCVHLNSGQYPENQTRILSTFVCPHMQHTRGDRPGQTSLQMLQILKGGTRVRGFRLLRKDDCLCIYLNNIFTWTFLQYQRKGGKYYTGKHRRVGRSCSTHCARTSHLRKKSVAFWIFVKQQREWTIETRKMLKLKGNHLIAMTEAVC